MPAFKRDDASRLRDAERCMKAGKPLTVREASFISLLMGHTERTGAATVRLARADSAAPAQPIRPPTGGRAKGRARAWAKMSVTHPWFSVFFLSFFHPSLGFSSLVLPSFLFFI